MTGLIERLFNTVDQKRFYLPSRLIWGIGCHTQIYDIIASHGDGASVMLFVDQAFADDAIIGALKDRLGARLTFVMVCRAMPQVQQLEAVARTNSAPDVVVSIGGGSTVDAAKAVICHWLFGTFDGIGMGEKRGVPWLVGARRPLLIGVPTTAGTGADVSRYYVTYDALTKAKTHGKSWDLIADWVLIDPVFLRNAPPELMLSAAFDAFIHLFETFICRGERSFFGDMLSLDAMTRLLRAMDRYVAHADRTDDTLLSLAYSAVIGGVAISNIRTGSIHEAAGALLELTTLSHPETLMVFLAPAYAQYRDAIAEQEQLLIRHLAVHAPGLGFKDFDEIIARWTHWFDAFGLSKRIAEAVAGISDWDHASAHLRMRVLSDRVWCEKESPLPLSAAMVDDFLKAALPAYRAA